MLIHRETLYGNEVEQVSKHEQTWASMSKHAKFADFNRFNIEVPYLGPRCQRQCIINTSPPLALRWKEREVQKHLVVKTLTLLSSGVTRLWNNIWAGRQPTRPGLQLAVCIISWDLKSNMDNYLPFSRLVWTILVDFTSSKNLHYHLPTNTPS